MFYQIEIGKCEIVHINSQDNVKNNIDYCGNCVKIAISAVSQTDILSSTIIFTSETNK